MLPETAQTLNCQGVQYVYSLDLVVSFMHIEN